MPRPATTKTAQQNRADTRGASIKGANKRFKVDTAPTTEKVKALKAEILLLKASMVEAEGVRDQAVADAWAKYLREEK